MTDYTNAPPCPCGQFPVGECPECPDPSRNPPIDWADFLRGDPPPPQWTAGRLMEHGQLVALVGHGKAGKSLFSLEWSTSMASGRPFLGDQPRAPIKVLYLDAENSHVDIRRRLDAFGYTPDMLKNLTYLSFPQIGPLDTTGGARDLMREIQVHKPDVVFIDTISRFIEGNENDASTWLSVYRRSMKPLKQAGLGVVRLDHFGKDADRGARGGSAKNQDVDHVWELTSTQDARLRLNRTHTRSGLGDGDIHLKRHGRPGEYATTWHQAVSTSEATDTNTWIAANTIAGRLDAAGIPWEAGRDVARKACTVLGIKVSNDVLSEAVRIRKEAAKGAHDLSGTGADTDAPHDLSAPLRTEPT